MEIRITSFSFTEQLLFCKPLFVMSSAFRSYIFPGGFYNCNGMHGSPHFKMHFIQFAPEWFSSWIKVMNRIIYENEMFPFQWISSSNHDKTQKCTIFRENYINWWMAASNLGHGWLFRNPQTRIRTRRLTSQKRCIQSNILIWWVMFFIELFPFDEILGWMNGSVRCGLFIPWMDDSFGTNYELQRQ